MALVRALKEGRKDKQGVHEETECSYTIFSDDQGNRFLQLDTYGSPGRKLTGKVSQTLQFDVQAASHLKRLIEETFPVLAN